MGSGAFEDLLRQLNMQSVAILWFLEAVMGFIAAQFLELALAITNFSCRFRHYGPLYKVRTVCTGSAELEYFTHSFSAVCATLTQ